MSGQCTGWVLRHGPRPDMVDRIGSKYGQRARGYRAVLVTIADAANTDGEHAYPGHQNMVDGSLYGRSQVVAIVRELVAEGWVTIEQEGGGRGKATVYRVEMSRETGHSPAGSGDDKPRDPEGETARSSPVNRATAPPSTSGFPRANVVPTKDSTRDASRDDEGLPLGASFEDFWTSYPKCPHKGAKNATRTEWQKRARDLEAVMEGLARWVTYWTARDEPDFVCSAAKWLREERWTLPTPALRRIGSGTSYDDQPVTFL